MIKKIQECFRVDRIYYSRHARDEMESEESGEIQDEEVFETLLTGKRAVSLPVTDECHAITQNVEWMNC